MQQQINLDYTVCAEVRLFVDKIKYFAANLCTDKKEEIWLSPMTKAPSPTEMSKGQVWFSLRVVSSMNIYYCKTLFIREDFIFA